MLSRAVTALICGSVVAASPAAAQTTLVTIMLDGTSQIAGTISQDAPFIGGADSFATTLSGFAILEIDEAAGTVRLVDFMGMTNSPITLDYGGGFFGAIQISASTLTASYAGTEPSEAVPYAGSSFNLVNIPAELAGTAAVTGSIFLVGAINSSFNLADFGAATVPSFGGTLTNTGGDQYTLASSFDIDTTQPFTISGFTFNITVDVTVTLNGSGTGVVVGPTGCNLADVSEDFGTLDINDILTFADAFDAQNGSVADVTGEGSIDINDILTFADAFDAGCP